MQQESRNKSLTTSAMYSKDMVESPENSCSPNFVHYVRKPLRYAAWPLWDEQINPSMTPGSNLTKPLNLALKEYEWNSIEQHTKILGVRKIKWVRYAIFRLMQKEQLQLHCNAYLGDE